MSLYYDSYWGKFRLPADAREVTRRLRDHVRLGLRLDLAMAGMDGRLVEHLLPLVKEEVAEEFDKARTPADELLEYWFTTAHGCTPRRKPAGFTVAPPDPSTPFGKRLEEKLTKWKAAIDADLAKKAAEAAVATQKAYEARIDAEARRRLAAEREEAAILARMAELRAAGK